MKGRCLLSFILVTFILLITGFILFRSFDPKDDAEISILERELMSLKGVNAKLEAQNHVLRQRIQRFEKNNRAIEKQAREELGFIKDGEIMVILKKE